MESKKKQFDVVGVMLAVASAALVCLIFGGNPTTAQLDLPFMPGPPYPDPRGQNRWGVKFDPRKHGPPFDKRGSANRNVWHRVPQSHDREISREHRRPGLSRQRDSYWSPGKMRRNSNRPNKSGRRQNRRHNRHNGGRDQNRRRPRAHNMRDYREEEEEMSREEASWKWPDQRHKKYKSVSSSQPNTEDQAKFWKSWNAWYKKQIDVKEQLKKGKYNHNTFPHHVEHGPTYHVDAEEFENLHIVDDDDDHKGRHHHYEGGNSLLGGAGRLRDFYWTRVKDLVHRAKSMNPFVEEDAERSSSDGRNNKETDTEEEERPEGWRIFTTIGKGIDAAHTAMGSVRKTVGGSLIGTGMKYGGKMAMGAVMNVGTAALTTAIKSATLG